MKKSEKLPKGVKKLEIDGITIYTGSSWIREECPHRHKRLMLWYPNKSFVCITCKSKFKEIPFGWWSTKLIGGSIHHMNL
jgi:hypothetical protein